MKIKYDKETVIRYVAVVIFNIVFAAFCLMLCQPHFETNDDFSMLIIVSGLYGKCDPHMVFSNILLGHLLSFLYSHLRITNWYVLFHVLTVFFSSIAVSIALLDKKSGGRDRYIAAALFYVFFVYDCYVNLQFTKTAGIASIAGLVLIISCIDKEKLPWGRIVCGSFLSITGSMIRFNSFLLALFCAGAFYLVYIIVTRPSVKKIAVITLILMMIPAVGYGAKIYSRSVYQNDPGWSHFLEFNKVRAGFTDAPLPKYAENTEFYDSLGISQNDLYLYDNWTFDDPDIFTMDLMEEVIAREEKPDMEKMTGTLKEKIIPGLLQYRFAVPVLLVSLMCFFRDRKLYLLLISLAIVVGVCNVYFIILNRFLKYRVDLVIALSLFVMISLFLKARSDKETSSDKPMGTRALAFLLAGTVALNIGPISNDITTKDRKINDERQEYRDLYDRLYKDRDHLYLTVTLCDKSYGVYRWSDNFPLAYYENTYYLGEWLTQSPIMLDRLEAFGLSNPFRDSVDREDIYFVSNENYRRRIITYIEEHYYDDVDSEVVETVGDLIVYRIISVSEQ